MVSLDDRVDTWELRAHHLQYFHEDTDTFDFTHLMKMIRKWIKTTGVNVETIQLKSYVNPDGEQSYLVGVVEFVDV